MMGLEPTTFCMAIVLVLFARPLRRSDRRVSLAVTVDD
jgi:hypothetical protein